MRLILCLFLLLSPMTAWCAASNETLSVWYEYGWNSYDNVLDKRCINSEGPLHFTDLLDYGYKSGRISAKSATYTKHEVEKEGKVVESEIDIIRTDDPSEIVVRMFVRGKKECANHLANMKKVFKKNAEERKKKYE
jgi:hypothetical protein